MSDTPAAYADPRTVVLRAAEAFRPPRRVSVADYAAAHRWVVNPGGGFNGRWQHDEAPYLVGPMQALTSRRHTTCCLVGPGQCGKTEVPHNWLLQSVGCDPANFLWYMQTDRVMRDHVKDRIDPLISRHTITKDRLGTRPSDNTQEYKRFRNMSASFLVAAPSNLISRSAPRIVIDEPDNYDPSIASSIFTQAEVRRQTFGRDSMIFATSHPDRASGSSEAGWNAGIMQLYARSTRAAWYWCCPECNGYSSPNPHAARVMTLHYPDGAPIDEIADAARLLCPICGALIEDKWRRAMNIEALSHHGGWVHAGQMIDEDGNVTGEQIATDTVGFWVVGVMSTLALGGIGALARARVEAQRAWESLRDEPSEQALRQVMTKKWGIPFDPPRRVGSIEAVSLAERTEPLEMRKVPPGVRFLTAWSDVQGNSFRVMVRGWGARGESWVIDVINRPAEPASNADDWDALLEWATTAEYPLMDGSGRMMRVRLFGYDSAGAPGVTQQAYDVWGRFKSRSRIRLLGMVDNRPCWNVMPTKGLSNPNAVRLQVVHPDTSRKDRLVKTSSAIPVALFAANSFKDDLAGQLGNAGGGAWSVHFPEALKSPDAPLAWFEELVAEQRRPNGSWAKISPAARNEALDQMVGNHVLAHLAGIGRAAFWDACPSWAAEWDRNPGVVMPPLRGTITAPLSKPSAPNTGAPVQGQAFNPARLKSLASKLAS